MTDRVRVGITLPSFVRDHERAIEIASVAEAHGVDGVFAFDHLFRRSRDGQRRPAHEAIALLGAIAATTSKITIGTLVLRASLRPPASTAVAVATLERLAHGRLVIGIGAGDSESREENESFGIGFGSVDERVAALEATVRAARDQGPPIWVGGLLDQVRDVAAREADGWNAWGIGRATFAEHARALTATAAHHPFECSWSGLVVADESDAAATDRAHDLDAGPDTIVGGPEQVAAAVRELGDMGAAWVILGPVDAADPRTARVVGDAVLPLVR